MCVQHFCPAEVALRYDWAKKKKKQGKKMSKIAFTFSNS